MGSFSFIYFSHFSQTYNFRFFQFQQIFFKIQQLQSLLGYLNNLNLARFLNFELSLSLLFKLKTRVVQIEFCNLAKSIFILWA